MGKQEDSGATMGKASISRLQLDRYRRIAELSQVPAHAIHPSAGSVRDVFDNDPGWSVKLLDDSSSLRPQAAARTVKA